jgi:hypothetical protein
MAIAGRKPCHPGSSESLQLVSHPSRPSFRRTRAGRLEPIATVMFQKSGWFEVASSGAGAVMSRGLAQARYELRFVFV